MTVDAIGPEHPAGADPPGRLARIWPELDDGRSLQDVLAEEARNGTTPEPRRGGRLTWDRLRQRA